VLAGDYNVVPTDADIYSPASWLDDALLQPESRDAYRRLLAQGWVDAIRTLHPEARIYTFWDYMRNRWPRDAGLRIDHLLLSPSVAGRLARPGSTARCAGARRRATTRRRGSSCADAPLIARRAAAPRQRCSWLTASTTISRPVPSQRAARPVSFNVSRCCSCGIRSATAT
jgi:hypothetical protein